MTFPVMVPLGPWLLHPHPLFEVLAYMVGFQLYRHLARGRRDVVAPEDRLWLIAWAICGAALGSKVVGALVEPATAVALLLDPVALVTGPKTIVGGLAGGLLAVELYKWHRGIRVATGDVYALPLAVGIALGRLGCLLTGVSDRTCGVATTLAWGVDLGDGVLRHPTPAYEIAFLVALVGWLAWRGRQPHPPGRLFEHFLGAYMAFRLAIEALKPGVAMAGLTAIQWTCLGVLAFFALRRWQARKQPASTA